MKDDIDNLPKVDLRLSISTDRKHYKEGKTAWVAKVINESLNVFEKVVYTEMDNGVTKEPDTKNLRKDFFFNRQTYKYVGTVGEMNTAALKRQEELNKRH
jgi:hypothetical protein